MKQQLKAATAVLLGLAAMGIAWGGGKEVPAPAPAPVNTIENRLVSFGAFEKAATEARKVRATRRVTEEQFLEMAADPNTIILDTRSVCKVRDVAREGGGAPELLRHHGPTALEKDDPGNKETRILIYCNNNFDKRTEGLPLEDCQGSGAEPSDLRDALLATDTENIYELGPLLDVKKTKIELVEHAESSP